MLLDPVPCGGGPGPCARRRRTRGLTA